MINIKKNKFNILSSIYKKFNLDDTKEKNDKIGWFNMLLLSPIFFTWFWMLNAINTSSPVANPEYLSSLYYGIGSNSTLYTTYHTVFASIFLLSNVFSLIIISLLIDKFSIKKVYNLFTFLAFISIMAMFFSFGNFPLMVIFGACFGFFGGGVAVIPLMKISFQWFNVKKIALPISIYISIGLFGGIISGFLLPEIAHVSFPNSTFGGLLPFSNSGNTSFGFMLLTVAMLEFLGFLGSLLIIEKKAEIGKYYVGLKKYGATFLEACTKKQNWYVALVIGLMNIPVSTIVWGFNVGFLTNPYYINAHNAPIAILSYIISILFIGNFLGSYFFGWLSNRIQKRKIILFIAIILEAAVTFLLVIRTLNIASLFIIFFFIGFLTSAQNLGYTMIGEQNKPQYIATANALNSMVLLSIGSIVQNGFVLAVGQSSGSGQGGSFPLIAILIIPILISIPLFFCILLVETGPKAADKDKLAKIINQYAFDIDKQIEKLKSKNK